MVETPLTPERVLVAAEGVLRRHGPAKATVVDVARALGVSHGSVYRHFPTKAALRDAVVARFLERVSAPLAEVASSDAPAPERLRRWVHLLASTKQTRARDEPELFETYMTLTADAREVVAEHVESLVSQLAHIVADGVAAGEMTVEDPDVAARAVFDATTRFHKPSHAAEWGSPTLERDLDAVLDLVLRGLGVAQDVAAPT